MELRCFEDGEVGFLVKLWVFFGGLYLLSYFVVVDDLMVEIVVWIWMDEEGEMD